MRKCLSLQRDHRFLHVPFFVVSQAKETTMQSFLNQCFTHNPPEALLSFLKRPLEGWKFWILLWNNKVTHDGAFVQNISKKAKNTYRCSKISLHKSFKLILKQNVTSLTYLKISCRLQKCSVQSLNQQFYLVHWILFSNMSSLRTRLKAQCLKMTLNVIFEYFIF